MPRTPARALALALALLAAPLAAPAAAGDRDAEKPGAVVFLSGSRKGEPAPSPEGVDDLVVLSEVPEDDPWFRAVVALGLKEVKEVVPFRADRLEKAFARLAELRPGFAVVLVRPETLDVNFHFEFLERASRLDDDPFVDFAFGYLTGADPEEAAAFAAGAAEARRKGVPPTILSFGPSDRAAPLTRGAPHAWAKGFTERRFSHGKDDAGVPAALRAAGGPGVLHAWGHGLPERVHEGLTGAQVRESGLDLSPSLYFSGPCYAGVTGRWFEESKGAVKERRVAPGESFLLALLKARASAVLAGLDPDRGESAEHELEEMLATGAPLGLVAKSTWDDAVLAYRREELVLPRYADGKGSPFRDIHDRMIAGGACRALFGDPTWAPFEAAGEEYFRVETKAGKKGLAVAWKRDGNLRGRWAPVDVFRAEGGWTHRIRFRLDLPAKAAEGLRRFEVVSIVKDGEALDLLYPTAALERWGDRVRVHGMVIFPKRGTGGGISGGKDLEARFLFRK